MLGSTHAKLDVYCRPRAGVARALPWVVHSLVTLVAMDGMGLEMEEEDTWTESTTSTREREHRQR